MSDVAQRFVFGFFGVIALMIIFVRAGQYGGATGGTQSAQIITAGGGALTNLGQGLGGR